MKSNYDSINLTSNSSNCQKNFLQSNEKSEVVYTKTFNKQTEKFISSIKLAYAMLHSVINSVNIEMIKLKLENLRLVQSQGFLTNFLNRNPYNF